MIKNNTCFENNGQSKQKINEALNMYHGDFSKVKEKWTKNL